MTPIRQEWVEKAEADFARASGELRSSKLLASKGFVLIPKWFADAEVCDLQSSLDAIEGGDGLRIRRGDRYAARNLLDLAPALGDFVRSRRVRDLIEPHLGPSAFVVRSILFDKTPAANWNVPWHQDVTIAVRERVDAPGFGPWSVKAGVVHVQPPAAVLENMLTIRVHLDDTDEDNGALLVLPGSHCRGILPPAEIARLKDGTTPHVCCGAAGSVLLMRPLLLHASRPAVHPTRRRVLHFDFAAEALPPPARWHASEPQYA